MMDKIIHADRMIPAGLRREFHWRMSETAARYIAAACCVDLPPGNDFTGMTMFGMPIELIDADEVLLVMRVC